MRDGDGQGIGNIGGSVEFNPEKELYHLGHGHFVGSTMGADALLYSHRVVLSGLVATLSYGEKRDSSGLAET